MKPLTYKYVYRADCRKPTDIFQYGFLSLGNNINLISHVMGSSTYGCKENSAFVSTTPDLEIATEVLTNSEDEGSIVYIYRIRADKNFFSVDVTLPHLAKLHRNGRMPKDLTIAFGESELVALHLIPTQQIVSATEYFVNNERLRPRRTIYNPHYIELDTHSNAEPFVGSDDDPWDEAPLHFNPLSMYLRNAEYSFSERGFWFPSINSLKPTQLKTTKKELRKKPY